MQKKKILIVEDDPQMRELVALRLSTSGYEVFEASRGEEGLEKVKKDSPDLIILDVMLPGIGGYEVCARLKNDRLFSKIPIVISSARAGDLDKLMGFQCGANAYLAKPFDGDLLVKKIEELLKSSGVLPILN